MSFAALRRKLAAPSPVWAHAMLLPAILYLAWLAWQNRFIQDDAFISFRYAEHLARGQGLTWNPGERVEGFTNFLWTIAIAVALRLNCEVVKASFVLGITCFMGSLYFTYRLARELTDDHWVALGAVVLLGYNYTFSAYATGGLETQSQATLFAASAFLLARNWRQQRWTQRNDLVLFSVVLSAAVWTRLDSGILVLFCGGLAIVGVLRAPGERRDKLIDLGYLAAPFAILVGGLMLFKLVYFGDVLPNTFYAKANTPGLFQHGRAYVNAFVDRYGLRFLTMALTLGLLSAAWTRNWVVLALYAVVALWCLYVMKVGGDFMEYRFLVAVLPLTAALAAWILKPARREVLLALLIWQVSVSSDFHDYSNANGAIVDGLGVETVHGLDSHVEDPNQAWNELGMVLKHLFGSDKRITISVMAAGALCYYSRLRCIDMLGLNDKWIARHGPTISDRVGHQKGATLRYLVDRGVNLVVHPWARGDQEERITSYYFNELQRYVQIDPESLPPTAEIIELPINGTRALRVLYLQPNSTIDELLTQRRWRRWGINRSWRK